MRTVWGTQGELEATLVRVQSGNCIPLYRERSSTKLVRPSQSSKDREIDRLRDQVLALQREVKRNEDRHWRRYEDRLWRNDEERLHRMGPNPTPSHSQRGKSSIGEWQRNCDRRESSIHTERTVSPTLRYRREESPPLKERIRISTPQVQHSKVLEIALPLRPRGTTL